MGADQPSLAEQQLADTRAELAHSERMRGALTDVIVAMSSGLPLHDLLIRVSAIMDDAYESYGSAVYLWDPEIERLVLAAVTDPPARDPRLRGPIRDYEAIYRFQLRLGEGLAGWAAQHKAPVVIGHEQWKDPRCKLFPDLREEGVYESALYMPILLPDEEVLGSFGLVARRRDHFTAEHVRVLTEVSGLLATVIKKIRVDAELSRRAKVLAFLGELCGRLASSRPVGELMDSVAAITAEVMGSDVCMIVTLDRPTGRFVLQGLAPASATTRGNGDLLHGALDGHHDGTPDDQLFRDLALILPGRYAEAASAPLLAGAEHLGFISCYQNRRFSSADRDLLTVIAGQVALGLKTLAGADRHAEHDPAGELIGLLASGRADTSAVALAASLGLDLHKPHILVHARFVPSDGHPAAEAVADRFPRAVKQFTRNVEAQHPHSLLKETATGLIGLVRLAKASGNPLLQRSLQNFADDIETRLGIAVSAGLSSACATPADYSDAYREAAEALEVGSRLRGEGRIVRFDELGPDLYLFRMAADPRSRRDPWVRALAPLVDHDRRKGSDLLATLDAYLEARGNGTLTAEQLGLHRNTLRQRLDRIEGLTGIAFAETQDWLPIHFAVKLTRMQLGTA
jgi:GAF domain-containing protein